MLCVMIMVGLGIPEINVVGKLESVLVVEVRLIWLDSVHMQGNRSSSSNKLYQLHRKGRLCQHHRQEGKTSGKVKEEELCIKDRYCRSKLCISGVEDVGEE